MQRYLWLVLGALMVMAACKPAPPPPKAKSASAAAKAVAKPAPAPTVIAAPYGTVPQVGASVTAPAAPATTVSAALPVLLPPVPLPAAAPLQLQTTNSDRHRGLFNEIASEYFDFQWTQDTTNPHVIDLTAGELTLPDVVRSRYGLSSGAWDASPQLVKSVGFVEAELERRRGKAVEEVLGAQLPVHFRFDWKTLTPPYQQAARKLLEAGVLIRELHKRQMLRPEEDATTAVYERGNASELALLRRNVVPVCGRYSPGPVCDLLPVFPTLHPGDVMWPAGMTDEEFEALKKAGATQAADPFLSPFTVVRKNSEGGYTWVSYGKAPEFQPILEQIATILDTVAGIDGIDENFKKQLAAQAAAFRSEQPYPYDQSDFAWGAAGGPLELTIGPYESYRDPRGIKAFFEFVLGVEDVETTALIQKFKPLMQQLENGLAALIGPALYQPRKIEADTAPMRVIDTILASGDGNADGGPFQAYHLPNQGPMVDQGKGKRVIMRNHARAKFPFTQAIAKIALVEEQQNDLDPQAGLFNTTFHEISHGLGPRGNVMVKLSDGTQQQMDLLIGKYSHALEEAKADVAGQWAVRTLVTANVLTPDEARKCYITYVASLFRVIRYGLDEAHGRGAAMELNFLIEKGAVEARGERYAVNLAKMPEAIGALLTEIGRIQAAGDGKAAAALLEGYPKKSPAVLRAIVDRVGKAGIPREIAAYYHW